MEEKLVGEGSLTLKHKSFKIDTPATIQTIELAEIFSLVLE